MNFISVYQGISLVFMLFSRNTQINQQLLKLTLTLIFFLFVSKGNDWVIHDRTDNACTVSTSRCPIQSLRKVF